MSNRRLTMFFLRIIAVLYFNHFLSIEGHADPFKVEDYPTEAGIAVLGGDFMIEGFYPVKGFPSDVEILPDQSHFAVVTLDGDFLIHSGDGKQVYNATFEPLNDVDCVQDMPDVFLLTSRGGNRVFFYDYKTGEQKNIPFSFQGPVDADLLPGGNLLVCEAQAGRVLEISPQGEPVWQYTDGLKQPMDALRLPDGTTWISDFDNHRILVVTANGMVLTEYRGFEHPLKLTLLPSGSVLVADSDHQEIQEISPQGKPKILRGNLNFVQSTAWVPSQKLILCAIQNKFSPPQKERNVITDTVNAATGNSWKSWMRNAYLGLAIAVVLAWFSGRISHRSRLAVGIWLIALWLVIGITFAAQQRAAFEILHRPGWDFWLGTLLLTGLVARYAEGAFWGREKWREDDQTFHFPFGWRDTILLVTVSAVSLLTQYFYIRPFPGLGKLPWYLPMIVWGITLILLYQRLANKDGCGEKETSIVQFGPMRVVVPFTTGSVTLEEGDELDEPGESDQEDRLADSWANMVLILILLLAAALYMIKATSIPTDVHGDEAEVALCGIKIRDSGDWNLFNLGWYLIPNLFYLIPAWVMWLFGDNLFGIRMAGALIGLACVPVFFLLARRFFHSVPAAIATFLFATSSYFIHFSRIGIGYNQTALFTVAVMYCFVRGLQDKSTRWFCYAGVLAALGTLSYQATKILTPLVISSLGLLWMTRAISWRGLATCLGAYGLAFWVGIAPLGGMYLSNPDIAFSRAQSVTVFSSQGQSLTRVGYPPGTPFYVLMKNQIERSYLAPITFHDNSPYLVNKTYGGILDPIPAIFFMAGFFLLIGMVRHPAAQLLGYWVLCIPFVGSALTDHAPSYQRMIGLIPFLALIAAPVLDGILVCCARGLRWPLRYRLHGTAVVLVVLLILGMHRYFHQIMAKPQTVDEWTRIARYLDEAGPIQYTYFFGPPFVYFKYGTIRFLAPQIQGEDVINPDAFLKNSVIRRGPVCFLLVRNNRRYADELRRLYPGGREENHFNGEGGSPFTTYVVNF